MPDYPIAENDRYIEILATGGQTLLTTDFPVVAELDLVVKRIRGATSATLIANTDYTLSGLNVAAGCSAALAVPALDGDLYILYGETQITRPSDFTQAGPFKAAAINAELDKGRMIDQELRREGQHLAAEFQGLRDEVHDALLGQIPAESLDNDKLAPMPAGTVKANLNGFPNIPGNVTATALAAVLALLLPAGALTDAQHADMPAGSVKANLGGAPGAPGNASLASLLDALAAFAGDAGAGGTKGLVPAPIAGDAALDKYLAADGTWKAGASATGVLTYQSRAQVIALTVPAPVQRLRTEGYAAAGDFGGGVYDRAGGAPSHAGYFQDAGGAYWVLDADDYCTLENFGGSPAAASNTAALNAAAAFCAATTCKVIRPRVGVYTFTTKPSDITRQTKIVGPGSSVCNWVRAYSEAGGTDVGFITFRELVAGGGGRLNGSGLVGIMLSAASGTTGGTMLREITDGPITGYSLHDDLVITYAGTGTYHRCWLVDGMLNATPGGQGYRDVRARDCFFFKGAAGTEACRFLNATNLDVEYWTNGATVIYGGTTSETKTKNARATLTSLAQIFVGRTSGFESYGECDSLIHSSDTDNCVHWGRVGAGGYSNTSGEITNAVMNRTHGFVALKATPGRQQFPNGLIIQHFQATSIGTSITDFAFPTAFSSGCTPIVIGNVRKSTFVGVFTGGHTNTTAKLGVSAGTETVDCIAIGW